MILLQIYRLYVLHLETVDEGGGSVYRKKPKHKSSDKKEKEKDRKHKWVLAFFIACWYDVNCMHVLYCIYGIFHMDLD